MNFLEVKEAARQSSWDEFFAIWLPLLLEIKEHTTSTVYYFGQTSFLTVHHYYINIDHCDIWTSN